MKDKGFWFSRALHDSSLIKMFTSNLFEANSTLASSYTRANERGEQQPSEHFPSELYGDFHDYRFDKLPDFFCAGSTWVASAKLIRILQKYQLGNTTFYPTKLFQHDRKTLIAGDYSCVNFGEAHEVFAKEESPDTLPFDGKHWMLRGAPKNGDVAVRLSALPDVDMFVDPQMYRVLFLSDSLVRGLKTAGLTRRLGLRKCRIL